MTEYITKEAAIEVFEWGDADVIEDYGDGSDFGFSRGAIKSAINSIPAADVAPVVHGRWIHDGRRVESGIDWCHCSECGKSDNFCARTNYCPNCGAKMDGDEE